MENRYEIRGNTAVIFINTGEIQPVEALIGVEDLEKVKGTPGWLREFTHPRTGRAYARFDKYGGRVFLHRLIMNTPKGYKVMHRDGNGLNCQRANMVDVPAQYDGPPPLFETITAPEAPKKIKGVSFHKPSGRWSATVFYQGKRHCLPYSKTQAEAAARITEFKNERGIP